MAACWHRLRRYAWSEKRRMREHSEEQMVTKDKAD
jgi:hypothetical protein